MVDKVKQVSRNTSKAIQNAYEVVAMAATIAAAVKVATQPTVSGFKLWQVVAGVILAGVVVRVYTLLNKE
jgi:hypothetical protein